MSVATMEWVTAVTTDLSQAFTALFDREARTVLRFMRLTVGSAEAEDMTAEVFSRAWKAWPRFRGDNVGARTWLLRIARNLATDTHRRTRLLRFIPLDIAREARSIDPAENAALHDALSRLKPAEREVLALRAAGLSYLEMGTLTGRSENATRMGWSRAAKHLRSLLDA